MLVFGTLARIVFGAVVIAMLTAAAGVTFFIPRSRTTTDRFFATDRSGTLWAFTIAHGTLEAEHVRPWPNCEPLRWLSFEHQDGLVVGPQVRFALPANSRSSLIGLAAIPQPTTYWPGIQIWRMPCTTRLTADGTAAWQMRPFDPLYSHGESAPMRRLQVSAPLWMPAVILAALPAFVIATHLYRRLRVVRRRLNRRCPICNYDLRASPDRCPECGTIPTPKAARPSGTAG